MPKLVIAVVRLKSEMLESWPEEWVAVTIAEKIWNGLESGVGKIENPSVFDRLKVSSDTVYLQPYPAFLALYALLIRHEINAVIDSSGTDLHPEKEEKIRNLLKAHEIPEEKIVLKSLSLNSEFSFNSLESDSVSKPNIVILPTKLDRVQDRHFLIDVELRQESPLEIYRGNVRNLRFNVRSKCSQLGPYDIDELFARFKMEIYALLKQFKPHLFDLVKSIRNSGSSGSPGTSIGPVLAAAQPPMLPSIHIRKEPSIIGEAKALSLGYKAMEFSLQKSLGNLLIPIGEIHPKDPVHLEMRQDVIYLVNSDKKPAFNIKIYLLNAAGAEIEMNEVEKLNGNESFALGDEEFVPAWKALGAVQMRLGTSQEALDFP